MKVEKYEWERIKDMRGALREWRDEEVVRSNEVMSTIPTPFPLGAYCE